jgi:lysophospholipase L1-like esterase
MIMRSIIPFLILCELFWLGSTAVAQPFRDEIGRFAKQDSLAMPAPGQVLFVGSSSFRLWTDVQAYFPGTPILNRGFGGSTLEDMIYYEKKIITPYKPRKIVIYCGENDLASSDTVTAKHVLARFEKLFAMIRSDYPQTPVIYVSIKPSPSRQRLIAKVAESNELIRQFLRTKPRTRFVDVYHKMLDKNGNPRKELFIEDQLHMNRAGYLIWQKALKPLLKK